jgi:hypothetical protein
MNEHRESERAIDEQLARAAACAQLVITVDTEADDAWERPDRIELSNLGYIERFQALCWEYQAPPTYLVAYECATREEAINVLAPIHARGECEIGHHLHVWSTPPFEQDNGYGVDQAWLHAFQYELPDELFTAKAEALYRAIEQAYGVSPLVHRAGRWGVDDRTFEWLVSRGFLADTSAIPLRTMERKRGRRLPGPNFLAVPRTPHQIANGRLWEIPVTVDVPESVVGRVCADYLGRALPGGRVAARLLRNRRVGGGRSLALDPRYPDGLLEGMMARALLSGINCLNLALHSSELAPGTSPFSRTEPDLQRVWHQLERVLAFARRLGVRGATLSQAVRQLNVGRPLAA